MHRRYGEGSEIGDRGEDRSQNLDAGQERAQEDHRHPEDEAREKHRCDSPPDAACLRAAHVPGDEATEDRYSG